MTGQASGFAATLVLIALAASASAAGSWANYREGRDRAAAEGRPMLLFFDLGDSNSEFFLKEKFGDPKVQELAEKFVLVRISVGADDLWKRYGVERGPAVLLCDSRGDLLEKGYWRSAEALVQSMKEALRKFGPVIGAADRARADELTAVIREALAKMEYGKACAAARELGELTKENPYAERARVTIAQLRDFARSHIERTASLVKEGRYFEATLEYEAIEAMYSGLPESGMARKAIEELEKVPAIREAIEQQRAARDSRRALEEAGKLDEARPDLALRAWDEIVARWPSLPAGREAAELARARRDDPAAMARVREAAASAVCASRISMARSYIANKMAEKARPLLEWVVKEHPGTSFAKVAEGILAGLR